MVWTRGQERDFDGWAQAGAKGWAFKDVLPIYKAQEDWEGGANTWRGTGNGPPLPRHGFPPPSQSSWAFQTGRASFNAHPLSPGHPPPPDSASNPQRGR